MGIQDIALASKALVTTTNTSLVQSPSSKAHTVTTVQELGAPSGTSVTPVRPTPLQSSQPQAQKNATTSSQSPATPGRWQHPRMEEVIRRKDKSVFDQNNIRTAIINVGLLLACLNTPYAVLPYLPSSVQQLTQPYLTYTIYALSLLFLSNTAIAIGPYWRAADTCEDIPLTPSQRKLLGLPPSSRPATPQEREQWVTPPRYSRSATPKDSSAIFFDVSQGRDSSLSNRGSPLDNIIRIANDSPFASGSIGSRRESGSPFSPSPLKEKVLRGGFERRRSSFGMGGGSPLGLSEFDGSSSSLSLGRLDTPTKKTGLGLNSKWLYDKGRAGSPNGSRIVYN